MVLLYGHPSPNRNESIAERLGASIERGSHRARSDCLRLVTLVVSGLGVGPLDVGLPLHHPDLVLGEFEIGPCSSALSTAPKLASDMADTQDPFYSIEVATACATRDQALDKRDAWNWGIILGWDEEAMADVAKRHNWDTNTVNRLKRLRANYVQARDLWRRNYAPKHTSECNRKPGEYCNAHGHYCR